MKKALRYCTSLFLSLLVLLASGSFTLSRMVCLQSGGAVVAFSSQKECCKTEHPGKAVVKAPCCAVFNQHVAVGHFIPGKTQPVVSTFPVLPLGIFLPVPGSLTFAKTLVPFRSLHPPTVSCCERLNIICKLSV